MHVNYHYAVLSYCPDLTSPSAESFPVGMVAIGNLSNDVVFAISIARSTYRASSSDNLCDPFSSQILNNFHNFIDAQLREGFENTGADNFLPWLQGRLRNTIHISYIDDRVCDVNEEQVGYLINDALQLFDEQIINAGHTPPLQDKRHIELPDLRIQEYPVASNYHGLAAQA